MSLDQIRFRTLTTSCIALFIALSADVGTIAYVHAGTAPWWSWSVLPAAYMSFKAVFWYAVMLRHRKALPSTETCARLIRIASIEVVAGVAVLVAWQVWISRWSTTSDLILLALCMAGQMVFLLFGFLQMRAYSMLAASICALGTVAITKGAGLDPSGIVVLLVGGIGGLSYVAHEIQKDSRRLALARIAAEESRAEIAALSEENDRIANTDMLTEIGNRRSCFRDLEAALETAREAGTSLAFGIVDLDGFKTVNDSHGHLVGDRLLRAMAARLQDALAEQGAVYRLGGDEFAFIVRDQRDADALRAIGGRVIDAVHAPIHVGELCLLLGSSVGFATFPVSAKDVTELYDRADYALFNAKRTGGMKAVVFSVEHERDVRDSALLERTLREADLEAEFFLTFQPIVDSHDGRTLLLECLARWESPVLGTVPPARFIVAAEQCGFISNITPVLLQKALDAIRQWPDEVGISFNLSGYDLVSSERVLGLIAILMRSGVSPSRVEFEVTETALMMNLDEALANIHRLKATGARLALDDFGTGYSSLSQVQKLPLDKIKVDASFVHDLEGSEASRKIVSAVTALTRDLSLSCVVEGVETQEQLDILQTIGCRLIQGYVYSKPMRQEDVAAFLAGQSGLRTVAAN